MSDQQTTDVVIDPIKRRYHEAVNLPPDDLIKMIAEKLAEGVERACRFPPMLYHQVAGVLWAMGEIGAIAPYVGIETPERPSLDNRESLR